MWTPYKDLETIEDIMPLLEDNNKLIIPICDSITTLIDKRIDPYENEYISVDRDRATVIGLFTKIFKCYQDALTAYKNNKFEICIIHQRIIYEAYIKFLYLMKHGKTVQRQYRLISYKNRYEFYKTYPETCIEDHGYFHVRNTKFLELLKADGFTIEDLENNKKWKLDGKSFKQLQQELENEELYSSVYGMASDPIHSDWGEISQLHLIANDKEGVMCANKDYNPSHYRYIIPFVIIPIDAAITYIQWIKEELEITLLENLLPIFYDIKRVLNIIAKQIFIEYKGEKYLYE